MLKFLGVGSAFNTRLGNNSAFVRDGDSLLLIDCGGTVFERLVNLKILENIKKLYILITHCHPDHIGSLGDTVFYSHYILKVHPTVIHPDEKRIIDILDNMGIRQEIYTLIKDEDVEIIDDKIGKVSIGFVPVSHVQNIPAFGFKISIRDCTIFYSGDSNNINMDILNALENGQIKRLYQDTCGADYEGNNHLSQRKLNEIVKPQHRNKVYCMHLDSYFDKEFAKEFGFNFVEPFNP